MASWGYRVYTFELVTGKNNQLAQELLEHRERLSEVLGLIGEKPRIGKPSRSVHESEEDGGVDEATPEDNDYQKTDPTLNIRGDAYESDLGVIHARIALGERGLHDYATNPSDGTDRVPVRERSAETPRRVDFFFAKSQFEGFLVTEVVGMRDPVSLLVPWIRSVSLTQRKERLADINSRDKHFDGDGNPISKTAARSRVPAAIRIRVTRVADPVLLSEIISDINSMDTEFTQLDENNKETDKRLIVKVRSKAAQRNIVQRFLETGSADTDSIIKQTLEDLDVDEEGLKSANVDLTTVKARVRSDEGNTTLVPGKLSELFNYKFKGDGRPGNTPYYRTVLAKLEQLKTPAQVALSVPDDDEMIQWIDNEEESWELQEALNDA